VDTAAEKTCMFVFVRHGERADEVPEKGVEVKYSWDPPLTTNGKL